MPYIEGKRVGDYTKKGIAKAKAIGKATGKKVTYGKKKSHQGSMEYSIHGETNGYKEGK